MAATTPILVVYYSLSGNTEHAARDIAARLGADLERIRETARRRGIVGYLRAALDSVREHSSPLEAVVQQAHEHALTIIGTPIWAGKMTPAVRSYLKSLRGRVNDVAFFTTSGSTDGARVIAAMEALLGRRAVASVAFNERELRDPAAYEAKLSAFQAALADRDAPLARAARGASLTPATAR